MDCPPPKRPLTAFVFFSKAKRSDIKEEHPEATGSQIMTRLASAWNKLSEAEREPFQALASKDRGRFERQKREYAQEGKYYDEAGVLAVRVPKRQASKPGEASKPSRPSKRRQHLRSDRNH